MRLGSTAQRYQSAARIVSRYFVDEDAAFLEQACAGDAELRAEVEWMIAECRRATGAEFKTPIVAQLDAAPDAVTVPEAREYRVLSPLGFGGMGSVHLAERIDGRARQRIALKIMSAAAAGGPGLKQFHHERAILAELSHPNIAHLTDGGLLPDGRPFVAMEYIDGQPIDDYCRERALTIRGVIELVLPITQAIAYAHRKLIIHRDIKPSNILVSRDGIPKLVDFGIAEVMDEAGVSTRTGLRSFTPAYASPEQIAGRPLTTATDQFSLGLVLEELLRLGRNVARLPRELQAIVAKATARAEADRYDTIEAMAADLRNYLAGRPVAAMGSGSLYLLRKFLWRARHVAVAAALVLLGLLGFALERSRQSNAIGREREARLQAADLLVMTLQSAGVDSTLSTGVVNRVQGAQRTLAGLPRPEDNESYAVSLGPELLSLVDHADVEALLRDVATLDVDAPSAERRVGTLLFLSRAYQQSQRFDVARDLAAKALQIERRRASAPSSALARALGNMANAWAYGPGPQAQHAFDLFDEALDVARRAQPVDPVLLAELHGDYAAALIAYDQDATTTRRALAEAEAALRTGAGDALALATRANITGMLAWAYWRADRYSAAGRTMDEAWDLARAAYAPGDPRRCRLATRYTLIFTYWEPKFVPAVDELTRVCATYLDRTADARLRVDARSLGIAAYFHPATPDTVERIRHYGERIRRLYGPLSIHNAYALYFAAVQLRNARDYAAADQALRDAIAYFPTELAEDLEFFRMVVAAERVRLYRHWPGMSWMTPAWIDELERHDPLRGERWYSIDALRIDPGAPPEVVLAQLTDIQRRLCATDTANASEARPHILSASPRGAEVPLLCAPAMSYPPLGAPLPAHAADVPDW